jgi:hypothetical protein
LPDSQTPKTPLSDEDREKYLRYVMPTKGTPEELATIKARWTDDRLQDVIDINL